MVKLNFEIVVEISGITAIYADMRALQAAR
jgi:hypothetical protein